MSRERESKDPSRIDVALLFVVGLLVAPALFAGVILNLLLKQNEIANEERLRQAQSLVSVFAATSADAAIEGAYWEEGYRQVVVSRDAEWFQSNFGATQFGTMTHEAALVLNGYGAVWTGSWRDQALAWDPRVRLGRLYDDLLVQVDSLGPGKAASSFARVEDAIFFAALTEYAPPSGKVATDRNERAFLLMLFRLDGALIHSLRDTVAWSDLGLSLTPVETPSLPLVDRLGETVGYLTWDYPTPGGQAFRRMLPFVLTAFGFTALSILGFSWRISLTARRLRAARAEALRLADCDALTGIPNRRVLQRAVERTLRDRRECRMLMIDFDGFKEVNDRLGHKVGDALLIEMSARMHRLCAANVLLARLGGDEFAVLCDGPPEAVAEFGRDLILAISAPFEMPNQTLSISASVGIAEAEPGISAEELFHRADAAMYEAKGHKPGAVRFYHPGLDEDARLHAELDREMRTGIGRGEFWVAYQPIYSVADHRVVAVEALARWQHPTRGAIGPQVFVPVAEKSRFIVELGEFVLREACTAFAGAPELKVSVNLSPVQLLDDRLVGRIAAVLAETGFPAARLELEVTEGYLIEQEDRAAEVMRRLRDLGVLISLDDFGCGYASVGYLRRFPLDKIKIDRSFIECVDTDDRARRIVAALITLCRAFEIPITAEGVETPAQAELLRQMGCDLLQGYLIGRPVSQGALVNRCRLAGE